MKSRSRQNSLDLGEEPDEPKKRGRKPRKSNNTELMNEFRNEIETESGLSKQRAYYENLHHLSGNERALFEAKFTKPKNDSQMYYSTLLKQKSKKIIYKNLLEKLYGKLRKIVQIIHSISLTQFPMLFLLLGLFI
jgi:hypothetical protein